MVTEPSPSKSVEDGLHDEKPMSELTSSTNVRLHDDNETNMDKRQYSAVKVIHYSSSTIFTITCKLYFLFRDSIHVSLQLLLKKKCKQ